MLSGTPRPLWITFDCYGTLIQWDEGLQDAVATILASKPEAVDAGKLIATYDRHEHALEQTLPHRSFRVVAGEAIGLALRDLGLRDVWIDRGTGRRPTDNYRPHAVLPSLNGLPALFQDAGWM